MPPPFAAVYFDCDSTLTRIEGIDELLRFVAPARRTDIAALTERAMNGELPLAEVYAARLAVLQPTRAQLDHIGALYVAELLPDAGAVVAALQHLGKVVGICSGGLLGPVQAVAAHLGLRPAHVHAVPVEFDADGRYRDFDRRSPLWRNGGKVEVMRALPAAQRPVAFVGDGVTDLETQGTVDRFVGFGGVVARPKVRAGAEAFAAGPGLATVLPHLLTAAEAQRLRGAPAFASLLPTAPA